MNKLLTAIALTIALPAVAHAQAPAPAPKAEKMKAEGKECCSKDMATKHDGERGAKDGADAHAGHDKSGADLHQNHQQ